MMTESVPKGATLAATLEISAAIIGHMRRNLGGIGQQLPTACLTGSYRLSLKQQLIVDNPKSWEHLLDHQPRRSLCVYN
jgi:hypothetical protein